MFDFSKIKMMRMIIKKPIHKLPSKILYAWGVNLDSNNDNFSPRD